MIVIGNPPYSISSNNKGEWISQLLEDYKKNLNERNIQPLSDDYIKFIRLAQYYVERNGEGIVAYISNNSFIDGLIHRQMRSELIRVFDKIYILDLHGNTRKKEVSPDGSKDENVFDIMQGVSINIFVKKAGKNKAPAKVWHFDLFGTRSYKYEYLHLHTFNSVEWHELQPQEPGLFFIPQDISLQKEYDKGFWIQEMLLLNTSGIKTHHDLDLVSVKPFETEFNQPYLYRPLDNRYINYDLSKVVRHRYEKIRHLLNSNLALIIGPQGQAVGTMPWNLVFVSDKIVDTNVYYRGGGIVFPLYLYSKENSLKTECKANLDEKIWADINTAIGKETAPEDIFDYIYGVLHSPAYRTKYKEFLKVDFPRIPYPKDDTMFEHYRGLGHELRELHLMHNVPTSSVVFPETGSMIVEQVAYDGDKVHINDNQYFANIPAKAWNFYIGGYQPAQKWLKDRKGRTLSFDDIEHYCHIIAVLLRTAELMQKIDEI